MYSPYDFNQSIAHRAEYVEERLKGGSPVVALSYDGGVLMFTVKRMQRKIFEIYDQIMYAAIGNQADIEAVRLASIDFAHQEGFVRSPDDVSIQRLVGFAISPPLKRAFGDPMSTPNVLRAIFVEVGKQPDLDSFFVLNYDGEFEERSGFTAVGGSNAAEEAMLGELDKYEDTPNMVTALKRAATAWALGNRAHMARDDDDEDEEEGEENKLADALQGGIVEAAVLERNTPRESKFRLLRDDELKVIASD